MRADGGRPSPWTTLVAFLIQMPGPESWEGHLSAGQVTCVHCGPWRQCLHAARMCSVLPVERLPEAPPDHPPAQHSQCQCTLHRSPVYAPLGYAPQCASVYCIIYSREQTDQCGGMSERTIETAAVGRPRLDRVNRCSDCGRPRATTRFDDSTYSVC